MSKITEVYMMVNGEQMRFTIQQYFALRESDPRIRALKFIPVDNRMYEATPEHFREWKRERNRRAYQKTRYPKYGLVSFEALVKEDGTSACEFIPDESTDVAEQATTEVMLKSLRWAIEQLDAEDRQLIQAIYFEGMTEREYAGIIGISQPAVHKRLCRIIRQLKKYLES